jgi:hypothetical protein
MPQSIVHVISVPEFANHKIVVLRGRFPMSVQGDMSDVHLDTDAS